MMAEFDTAPLMLLLQEISRHPFDHSYVEGIVNVALMHLFARTREAGQAFDARMEAERLKLAGEGGAR